MIERHFSYWLNSRVLLGLAVALPLVAFETQTAWSQRSNTALKEIDDPPAPESNYLQAVVGATLIDGRGGAALKNSVVVIRGNRIEAIGPRDLVPVPAGATVVEATGLTLLPGLLDSHFHTGGGVRMTLIPGIFLRRGVTSARDPGRPFAHYDPIRALETPVPRLFLTGGHLDQPPPAHPSNAELVADEAEARLKSDTRLAESEQSSTTKMMHDVTEHQHREEMAVIDGLQKESASAQSAEQDEHASVLAIELTPPTKIE